MPLLFRTSATRTGSRTVRSVSASPPRADAGERSARPSPGDSQIRRCRTKATEGVIRRVREVAAAWLRDRCDRPGRPRRDRDRRSNRRSGDEGRTQRRECGGAAARAKDQNVVRQGVEKKASTSAAACRGEKSDRIAAAHRNCRALDVSETERSFAFSIFSAVSPSCRLSLRRCRSPSP